MSRRKRNARGNTKRTAAISRRKRGHMAGASQLTTAPRRKHREVADAYDSDDSFLPGGSDDDGDSVDSVIDDSDDGEGESHTTDVDDFDRDGQLKLYAGNYYPPGHYLKELKEFDESGWEAQDYSPSTTALLDAMEEQWHAYCSFINLDPRECYETLSLKFLCSFFRWMLNQRSGKSGRTKPGIKKKSTLETYWKLFRLVFERAMKGEKIKSKLGRQMHRALRKLAEEHKLSRQKRANRCMTIDQLKEKVETTLSTTKKMFKLGELRILAVLFLLLLAPAGSRPDAILSLRFRHIRVVLARDPEGGPHNTLIQFTPEFTKTYLGAKDATTYTIPETLCDSSLLLSPHIFLLGVLFRHRAFRAARLTSAECLEKLDIYPGELELPLPLREDLDDVPLFRQAVMTLTGYEISLIKTITYGTIAAWFKTIGAIMGLEAVFILYSLRYNAANGFDESNDVSTALRNLALGHADSTTFPKHYLGRIISADLWGVLRGQRPQAALLKQSCSIGHSISKRRPTELTSKQVASINNYSSIKYLARRLENLPKHSKEYKETNRKLQNEKLRLKRELLQKTRAEWTPEQATDDIERQLQGKSFAKPTTTGTSCRPQKPAQKRLVEALTAPVPSTLRDQYKRRNDAVSQVSAYCLVQEGATPRRSHAPSSDNAVANEFDTPSGVASLSAAKDSVMVHGDKAKRPRSCFVCIGQALRWPTDYDPKLTLPFYTSNDLTKHFKRRHLNKAQEGEVLECKVCETALEGKTHFRRHAQEVHGTLSGKM